MHFDQSKSIKCELFGYLLNSPWQKMKNVNLYREKVFEKAWKSAHIGFWVCQLQCTMLELCVRSTLLSYDGFSWFLTAKFRHRVLKHCVGVELDPRRTAAYVPFHFDGFNPILCYLSPKILNFQEPLTVETWNKCHCIWHALDPKYVPLKPLWCIFSSQNQQNMKFYLKFWFFQEMLIVETQNLCHWIQHASSPKLAPLKPFQCILTSQNQ